jgi:hypothetical protein
MGLLCLYDASGSFAGASSTETVYLMGLGKDVNPKIYRSHE